MTKLKNRVSTLFSLSLFLNLFLPHNASLATSLTSPSQDKNQSVIKQKPLALIYDGQGSCKPAEGESFTSCAEAAKQVAEKAGFIVKYATDTSLNAFSTEADYQKLFKGVSVWIHPGGTSTGFFREYATLELQNGIRRFVREGGGYVGFCAGAFLATLEDADEALRGTPLPELGIFPGRAVTYPESTFYLQSMDKNPDADYSRVLPFIWNGKLRQIYWENGPYLEISPQAKNVKIVATYASNGKVAAAKTTYGKGRVFISGPHPEAPQDWYSDSMLTLDSDGRDSDLAAEMVLWASKQVR